MIVKTLLGTLLLLTVLLCYAAWCAAGLFLWAWTSDGNDWGLWAWILHSLFPLFVAAGFVVGEEL